MQIQEQIYTSASKLLDPAQSDLGVVAESVGFPSRVASQLKTLASYRILQSLPIDDPTLHPSRIVAMPHNGGLSYSVSRIVFAGADHTGRTKPLAHHILLNVDDLVKDGVNLADTIESLRKCFIDEWNQAPERFDPPRTIEVTAHNGLLQTIGLANSTQLANVVGWIAARYVDGFESISLPVVFVLPTDQRDAALYLLATLQRAIAASKQSSLTFQSHVNSSNDLVGPAHIVATYPNSEYLSEIQSRPEKRRPHVVDLSTSLPCAFSNVGFASWYERKLRDNSSQSTMLKGLQLRVTLNDIEESKYPDGFTQVWDFHELLTKRRVLTQIDEIGSQSEKLSNISQNAARLIDNWTCEFIKQHVEDSQSNSDWQGLVQILSSNLWPKPARKLCLEAITRMPEFAFPALLANRDAMRIADVQGKINETIGSKPDLWSSLLNGAPHQASKCRQYLESRVASGKLQLSTSQLVTEVLMKTGSFSEQENAAQYFLTSLSQQSPVSVKYFEWLQSLDRGDNLLKTLLVSRKLPPHVAESLDNFLHPQIPAEPQANSGFSFETNDETKRPTKQFASSASSMRSNHIGIRQFHDPRPLVLQTACFTGIITILAAAHLFWTWPLDFSKLSNITTAGSLASVIISMFIAGGAWFWFSTNRVVGRQWPLMIICYFSVAFMIASAIAVIVSSIFLYVPTVFQHAGHDI
jgi:hypothetical protein